VPDAEPPTPADLEFAAVPVDSPDAAQLLAEYVEFRAAGFAELDLTYLPATPDPAVFTPPAGVFLVARDGSGALLGCGGIRMLDPARAEVKHLWLRPAARGRGLGRALLLALEDRARGFGAREAVLDTNAILTAAQGLYRTSGYAEIPPYNDTPNATRWFAKAL